MATEKILEIRKGIESAMDQMFPRGYIEYVFGGKLTPDDVITQVLVECSRYTFNGVEEKNSLRHYFVENGIDEESDRRRIHRSLEKAYQYKEDEYAILASQGFDYPELLRPPMDTIEQKTEGYSIDPFQYWELNNIKDMELVSSIFEKRISKKNTTVQQIIDMDQQYCSMLRNIQESEDKLLASMAMFVLEWKYSFDFIYEVADAMEKNRITYSNEIGRKITAFCGRFTIDSCMDSFMPAGRSHYIPVHRAGVESRMLQQRRKYIPDILDGGMANEPFSETHRFLEGLVMVSLLVMNTMIQGIPIHEWFMANTDRQDWISVFEDYDVFGTLITDKDWTNKTVRNLKAIYKNASFNF